MFKTVDVPASSVAFGTAFWRNRLLLSLVGLQLVCAVAVSIYAGRSFWDASTSLMLGLSFKLFLFMFANFVLWRFGVAVFSIRPAKPIKWLLHDLWSKLTDPQKAPDAVLCFGSIVALIASYTFLKNEIHAVNPSLWDAEFARWDRWLHGGFDPWVLLWPIFGSPYVTTALNVAYHMWFPMLYIAVCVACLDRRDPNRCTVFLVAFVLCWFVGGNLLATVFASVGPVYFEAFGLGLEFAPQMEMLRQSNEISPVWSLSVQNMLLEGYHNAGPARGISAMPSMHVASSVLLAFYGFSYARWAGWALTGFAFTILLGSVHLGWHYAIDGYASGLLMVFFWWLAKKLTARFGPNA
ncbi:MULTISPECIES: phosphatase PAP2 family protein [unclassified Ruegeria]|uniref:phosphatase PAP2 family protein n=1 Tax=unclassified Ruegeria TaxID=2625375 RepID=UPI00148971EA|nr:MULTISPECIES: phosphatase PAP2 family protein [unclassified Ruegeria]